MKPFLIIFTLVASNSLYAVEELPELDIKTIDTECISA